MTYIPRTGAEALMPEEYQKEIVQSLAEGSAVMSLGSRAPDMSRAQRRIPCLSVLPTAYFSNPGPSNAVEGAQWKRLSRMMWENKYLDAEELNVIVAIPEAVLDDADYDIWGEAKPKLIEAFGLAFDQAVFYGTNAPAVWPTDIVTACAAAGNSVVETSNIYNDVLGLGGTIAKVEEDGFMVNGHVAAMNVRSKLRALKDTANNPIFKALAKEGVQGSTDYRLDGERCIFPRNGAIVPSSSSIITGDWSQLMYAIRKDLTWKILTEAVIQDTATKEILYNLPQQNMVALRACMRVAWQVPNPINRLNDDDTTRYPFATLIQAGS